jgi:hypothetical protein
MTTSPRSRLTAATRCRAERAKPAVGVLSKRGARAQAYGPDEGKEIAPGVRVVEVSQREAIIPGYKTVKMIDVVFQPGSHAPQDTMENDIGLSHARAVTEPPAMRQEGLACP